MVTTMLRKPTQNHAIYGVLLVYTACCRRMLDVQQHEALSQMFMPFCEHAQNPAIYGVLASLDTLCNVVRLIESIYSWV